MRTALMGLTLLAIVGALAPTAPAGPTIRGGPAPLLRDAFGPQLAVLAPGTPLVVNSASCEHDATWVDVTVGDRVGWVSTDFVDFGAGVPLSPAAWEDRLELLATPLGDLKAVLPAHSPLAALGVACGHGRGWIRVRSDATEGWLPGWAMVFRPDGRLLPPPPGPGGGSVPVAPTPSPGQTPAVPSSLQYGVHVFPQGPADAAAAAARVKDLRFTWMKALVRWRDVEGAAKGTYDWSGPDALVHAATTAGLQLLVRVDFQPAWARADGADDGPPDRPQDYADFLSALVTRYRGGSPYGHLHAVEVWNEPNLDKSWGEQQVNVRQAGDYVRLLALAYDAVKAADPSVVVVSASLSPTGTNTSRARPDEQYLQWLYDAGMKGHFDALGAHAAGYKGPPELSPVDALADPTWGGDRSFAFRRVEDLRAVMVRNGDAAKPVWVTEFGWTSDRVHPDFAWARVSEAEKAAYLVQAFEWARAHWDPWIGPMMVWTLPDPTWGPQDEKYWWAITEPDGTPRPAYLALRQARLDGTLP